MEEGNEKKPGLLKGVESVQKDKDRGNVVHLFFRGDTAESIPAKITFLEEHIFRYDIVPDGDFADYAKPRDEKHTAKIQQRPDSSDAYTKPETEILDGEDCVTVRCGKTVATWEKQTGKMTVLYEGREVLKEAEALEFGENETVQVLARHDGEEFFGGGTQNGRFVHTGKKINIANESAWVDGGVASPNPFYYTTRGYGVLRNTFSEGSYDFGENGEMTVTALHKENRMSAYYFLSGGENGSRVTQELLQGYYHVTGNPLLLPEYGFYEGHLNCYNRDAWAEESGDKAWVVKGSAPFDSEGTVKYESGMATGYRLPEGAHSESLNGEGPVESAGNYPESVDTPYEFSARAVLDEYMRYDMPLGYFLPNDGYGGGYGQNGYYVQGGVAEDGSSSPERIAAVDANVENLTKFTEYANERGVASGLWTESNLVPDSNNETYWHLLRDFGKEVKKGGVTTLKTDVAWVGPGYSFQLNGVKTAYDVVTTAKGFRPNIISLDGWAGSQRFNSVWTGDQTGGNWEYIRFHIPTYIGSSLSGNPNIGSDMDGIFGGRALIATRDYQWKAFTPQMLNMDGWGSYMKAPYTFGDPYTGINRMYMKMKSRLMPYIYTSAVSASNIDTGNGDTGLPMVRAMFLEYPEDSYAYSRDVQYQFMLGSGLLVAPVYKNTAADEEGNDVRNHIYFPGEEEVWTDYLTGEKYAGGQVLNNFHTPLWKLPVFVKAGTILPMYEANNTPDAIDRTRRMVEFWPAGHSEYTIYEDDGKYICNRAEEEADYGIIDHVSYGDHVSTKYTSDVTGDHVVLTAEISSGNYEGYCPVRNTEFIVHLDKKPEMVAAWNGGVLLSMTEAADKAEFDNAVPEEGNALFFYEEAPQIPVYAPAEETKVAALVSGVKTAPKLYVKMAAADTAAVSQQVEIRGYEYQIVRMADRENPKLAVPKLWAPQERKTPSGIWLEWNETEGASSYEMLVDGRQNVMGNVCSYEHDELEYESTHSYRVRARNAEGYSAWSEELVTGTLSDPWRNEIGALGTITWMGKDEESMLKYVSDHNFGGMFFAFDKVVEEKIPLIYNFGAAYELDKFVYYPRDNYGTGTAHRMNVYSSLDGVHWKMEWDGASEEAWTYDPKLDIQENGKEVALTGICAQYLKLEVLESQKGYFATHELPVYKKDGSKPFMVGSTNKNETVSEGDYTNMKNYLGTSVKDGANFTDQIQKRCGDINMNGIYDVYDYAFTMFRLDGGTKQTGAVSGAVRMIPDAKEVAAGDVFHIIMETENAQNVNAFGKVLHYDPSRLEFVSVSQEDAVAQMENLTVGKRYADGTAYVNLAFANRGDKETYSGSGKLAVLTMKALVSQKPEEELDCSSVLLIGPQFDVSEN